MKTPILFLLLEGPLQSWGMMDKWNTRNTMSMPTKSGIVGILACAMGLSRGDDRIKLYNEKLQIAIRQDKAGKIISDFHTVKGQIRTAEGKIRGKAGEDGVITSNRQYLQDAAFLAAITGDEDLLKCCTEALFSPVWPVYLGRKNCVPTRPILQELSYDYVSLDDAIRRFPILCKQSRKENHLLCEIESSKGTYLRRDVVAKSPSNQRNFSERSVSIETVELLMGDKNNVL